MRIHLAWIRVTAAAAVAVGVVAHPAAAQYAPFRPIPAQPAAPQQAPAAAAPYGAYGTQPVYPQATYPQTAARYQPPAMTYQAPQQAPVSVAYRQPAVAYPQTATTQYPAAYGATPYIARGQQPTEVMPAPQQSQGAAPATTTTESMPAGAMPTTEGTMGAPAANGYSAAGCNCGAGGYSAGSYYGAAAGGSCGAYPDLGGCTGDCGNENVWFGGVYFLYMDRVDPSDVRLAVEVDHAVAPNPYYPPKSTTVVSTQNVEYDYRPGLEVRLGSTFQIGDGCDSGCGCGSGYSYNGCGCNTCSCRTPTTYAWEVAWWGLDNDANQYIFEDQVGTRTYGMKSFSGLEYDRDGAGAGYAYRPVNDYYDYQMPIPTPPGAPAAGYTTVLAQRVWTDFKAQNLEVNIMRFPMMCDTCNTGCGGCNAGGCGCNTGCNTGCSTGCNSGCGCDDGWFSNVSMYGSCGVRYFRIDDDFAYDVEFNEYDGAAYDQASYNGFTYDNSNELCYDINIENNLIGPQFGWTTDYCIGCRWNFFCNTTFGVFENHMTQQQRLWSGGGGVVRFAGTGESMSVRSQKDDIAFLGELRLGGSYDVTCHWRGVLAYRAVALSGIATSVGQIPDQFSSRAEIAQINSDNSMIIHGVQVGAECRY